LAFTLKQVEFVTSVFDLKQRPKERLPEIAVAGRSNVGKSSLLNCLFQRKQLAYTSKTPGKTQSLNYFKVNQHFYLVDLPGYGFAKAPKSLQNQWADLMAEYLEGRVSTRPTVDTQKRVPPLKGAVQLIDSRHGITPLDHQMIAFFHAIDLSFVIVATKADKLSVTRLQQTLIEVRQQLGDIQPIDVIPFSSKTKLGRDQLWNAILQLLKT
jgi:GTP-binding protein